MDAGDIGCLGIALLLILLFGGGALVSDCQRGRAYERCIERYTPKECADVAPR